MHGDESFLNIVRRASYISQVEENLLPDIYRYDPEAALESDQTLGLASSYIGLHKTYKVKGIIFTY